LFAISIKYIMADILVKTLKGHFVFIFYNLYFIRKKINSFSVLQEDQDIIRISIVF